jgi:RNA polymerase subunit RPABC4/transcription elongation factor Spt4
MSFKYLLPTIPCPQCGGEMKLTYHPRYWALYKCEACKTYVDWDSDWVVKSNPELAEAAKKIDAKIRGRK